MNINDANNLEDLKNRYLFTKNDQVFVESKGFFSRIKYYLSTSRFEGVQYLANKAFGNYNVDDVVSVLKKNHKYVLAEKLEDKIKIQQIKAFPNSQKQAADKALQEKAIPGRTVPEFSKDPKADSPIKHLKFSEKDTEILENLQNLQTDREGLENFNLKNSDTHIPFVSFCLQLRGALTSALSSESPYILSKAFHTAICDKGALQNLYKELRPSKDIPAQAFAKQIENTLDIIDKADQKKGQLKNELLRELSRAFKAMPTDFYENYCMNRGGGNASIAVVDLGDKGVWALRGIKNDYGKTQYSLMLKDPGGEVDFSLESIPLSDQESTTLISEIPKCARQKNVS